jgi:molybdate transport system permease protein
MSADASTPVLLSLRVALLALAIAAPSGLALAVLQARGRYPGRRLVDALLLLPLVLPPSVVGFLLVVLLGRRGPVGALLDRAFGAHLVFTTSAAVIASSVVALPLVVKTAQPAIEAVPVELEEVARTLGLPPLAVILRVTLPAASRGVIAAIVLGFARALGEFGATLMFAGDVPGRTETMPVAIFAAYESGDDGRAALYVALLVLVSVVVVLGVGRLGPRFMAP